MLRMVLPGFLILLGVGVLSAMELRTPARSTAAIIQPVNEPTDDISDSHDALAKADRLDVAAMSSKAPEQAVRKDEGVARPEDIRIASENIGLGSLEPPKPIARHRHTPKKVTTVARPKSEPKASVVRRTAISQPSKAASDTEPCRLAAFGGLRKALNSADCEI
ncbi:hypothetical protein [Bradyrhizobium sp. STM 3557]|uniref:hypothetical protein n=1 Tax=Bradyrhizobium sp. STM 3557 TaxID=578920 RepID=UPI00388DABBD